MKEIEGRKWERRKELKDQNEIEGGKRKGNCNERKGNCNGTKVHLLRARRLLIISKNHMILCRQYIKFILKKNMRKQGQ